MNKHKATEAILM